MMLRCCLLATLLALVPEAHMFKSNSSIIIYHLVDEFNTYIQTELRAMVNWPSDNRFMGPGIRFAIHERYCGDFSTLTVVEDPTINATYHKRTETMVYQCDVVLGLQDLYFGFVLDIVLANQDWESSDSRIHAGENACELSFEVHVRKDGFCKVNFLDSTVLYLGNYDVEIEPQNHFARQWFLWLLTRGIVWSYYDYWNEMLKGTLREDFKSPGVTEIICKAFTPRDP